VNFQSTLVNGTVLQGKYRIEGHIASGGFGNTYVATHMLLEQKVAVKEFFIKGVNHREDYSASVKVSNLDNFNVFEEQKRKFKKEAKRLFGLNNEHIVRVFDLFEENNTVYYVMDFVDGESLRDRIKRQNGPFFESEALSVLRQMLTALDVIHEKSMWHMDIKPANILIDDNGKCTLIDFGSSKQSGSAEGMTLTTGLSYTPGYAPSEQVNGINKRWGPWTDFYSLGATLYNIITTKTPPMAADIIDDKEEAFDFDDNLSGLMKDLIMWMMQPSSKNRPKNSDEIRDAIIYGNIPKHEVNSRFISKFGAEDWRLKSEQEERTRLEVEERLHREEEERIRREEEHLRQEEERIRRQEEERKRQEEEERLRREEEERLRREEEERLRREEEERLRREEEERKRREEEERKHREEEERKRLEEEERLRREEEERKRREEEERLRREEEERKRREEEERMRREEEERKRREEEERMRREEEERKRREEEERMRREEEERKRREEEERMRREEEERMRREEEERKRREEEERMRREEEERKRREEEERKRLEEEERLRREEEERLRREEEERLRREEEERKRREEEERLRREEEERLRREEEERKHREEEERKRLEEEERLRREEEERLRREEEERKRRQEEERKRQEEQAENDKLNTRDVADTTESETENNSFNEANEKLEVLEEGKDNGEEEPRKKKKTRKRVWTVILLLALLIPGIMFFVLPKKAVVLRDVIASDEQQPDDDTLTITVGKVSFKMIYVHGGAFNMGATSVQDDDAEEDEKPVHRVNLKGFYIAQTEVTQELWNMLMDKNPSGFKGDSLPVDGVSWEDCQEFIEKLNKKTKKQFRLPTEAEWEYAACGGVKCADCLYAGSNDVKFVAWRDSDAYFVGKSSPNYGTHKVATKQPNELGIYDMSGNVREWCQDSYAKQYYSKSQQDNPTGPTNGKIGVVRGGSWYDYGSLCRVSKRFNENKTKRRALIGLRLVLPLEEQKK